MRTLYVGGLSQDASPEELRRIFSTFGSIADARVVMRPSEGSCRGFGYVTFSSDAAALSAMRQLDGSVVQGNRLRVDLAR